MRILQIYNRYRSGGGGETLVVNNTMELLRQNGHEVRLLERDSAGIISYIDKLGSAISGVYSIKAGRLVSRELREWRPDIVHTHNLYPMFTPSVLVACKRENVPVVMTVHNYGLTCPIQTHVRDGAACTECVDHGDQRCVTNNCRDNVVESVVYAGRHAAAKALGLFRNNVTLFLPVSEFVRKSLLGANIPSARTFVLHNGVPIPGVCADPAKGKCAVFLGRFTPEKGVETLIAAAKRVPKVPVRFYGDGPSKQKMESSASANVSIHSWVAQRELAAVYRDARCIVVPSTWHDPCPMVVLEAMSYGVPVVASRMGGLTSLVLENETGFLVTAGEPIELGDCLHRLEAEPALADRLGRRSREIAKACYSDSAYYARLMEAYVEAARIHKEDRIHMRGRAAVAY